MLHVDAKRFVALAQGYAAIARILESMLNLSSSPGTSFGARCGLAYRGTRNARYFFGLGRGRSVGCRRYGHLAPPIRASEILRSKFVAIRHSPADSKHHWKKRPPSFGLELLSGLGPIAKP